MRILFVSNFYPPYARGGYEQWCSEVADELVARGNSVGVLTSKISHETEKIPENGVDVYRSLTPEVEKGLASTMIRLLTSYKRLEKGNLAITQSVVADFKPDVILIWGMWNISRAVPALLEQLLSVQVAYYICDYWLTLPNAYIQRFQEPANRKWLNVFKYMLSKPFLNFLESNKQVDLKIKTPICVSGAVKKILIESGIPIEHARVVYGGTQISETSKDENLVGEQRRLNGLKLLYVGRLDIEKGVHTIIRALPIAHRILGHNLSNNAITLDIVGNGDPAYFEQLESIVEKEGVTGQVNFLGGVARSDIPNLMMKYDVLVFPSEWQEPFARTVLEAMSVGLLVIGTTTGGTGELLVNLETGLTFQAGDFSELANKICYVFQNPELRSQLAKSGQKRVEQDFTFSSMVDNIEMILHEISEKSQAINTSVLNN